MRFKDSEFGIIPEHWDIQSTFNYCKIITDYVANGSFKSLADNVNYNQGEKYAVLIRLTDYHNGFQGEFVHIDKQAYEFLGKTKLHGEEIIIANVGANVGTVFLVPKLKRKMSLGPNSIMIKTNGNDKFYYYWFKSRIGQGSLQSIITGSAQPKFNKTAFRKLNIPVPPVNEQKAIANILSSLDDKIELNNKINKNLEDIAQTLYKRWFVDFEFPNEDGEPYKSSGGEMVESDLGLIPKGWSLLTLDELVVKSSTKTNPDSNEKLIDMANMPSYSIALNSFDNGDKLSTNTYKMKKFSFLYGSIRPYLGKFGIAPFDGITTGTIHNFNVKNNSDYSLVATTVFSTKFNEFCIKLSHGTKMPTIKWDDFVSYIVIYSDEVSYMFNKIVRVIYEQIVNNVLENVKLSKTLDELLPKLMNGEIEVPIEE